MWLLLVSSVLAAVPAFDVSLSDGPTMQGPLVELSAHQVVVETPTGRSTLPAEKLVTIQPAVVPAPGASMAAKQPPMGIDLLDGSTLSALEYRVENGVAEI